jgi:hypothetical protein
MATLPLNFLPRICGHLDIQTIRSLFCLSKEWKIVLDTEAIWEIVAKKMCTEFPMPPAQGWKGWVAKPTPVEFELGYIDLVKRIIGVYPWGVSPCKVTQDRERNFSQFAIDLSPLINKIPGKLTCLFSKPLGAGEAWYRNEQGELITASDRTSPEGEQYLKQKSESDNWHFGVRVDWVYINASSKQIQYEEIERVPVYLQMVEGKLIYKWTEPSGKLTRIWFRESEKGPVSEISSEDGCDAYHQLEKDPDVACWTIAPLI